MFSMLLMLAGVGVRTWVAWRDNVAAMSSELALVDKVSDRALDKAIWHLDHVELERDVEILSQVKAIGFVELKVLRAVAAGQRLQSLLAQAAIPHADSKVATHVTLSIGAAQLEPGMDNVDALLREADLALYRAKAEGRNRVAA